MGVNGIYGLSGSGLDIESLVKVGMMNKQNQYDKMYQNQVKNTWLKEAYNEIYTKVNDFQTATSAFKLQSNMNAMAATSTDNNIVTVSANGAAAAMSHKVSVTSVASNAYVMTGMKDDGTAQTITRNGGTAGSTALQDVLYKKVESYTADDNTTHYKITMADDTVKDVAGTDTAISLKLKDTAGDDATEYELKYTFDDLMEGEKTLQDLASAMGKTGANVQGGYDAANDSFSLYNKTSGSSNILSLTAGNEDTATLLNNMHLSSYSAQDNVLSEEINYTVGNAESVAGTNAKATIDGKTYDLDTNVKTVAGVTYTFNNVSEAGKTTTVNVSQDTTTIVDNVKKFVEAYNTLLDDLNSKLSETKYSDYKPLTQSQEESMTKEQIDKWNEKAKSGLFYNDSNIRSMVSAMREAIYTPVEAVDSKYNSMSAIGITSSTTKGHITLDESKLTKALSEDPDCVYQLFASSQDSSYIAGTTDTKQISSYEKKLDYQNTGVANRLYDLMSNNMSTIKDYAGTSASTDDNTTLGNLITSITNNMSSYKTQMTAYQTLLYNKYDAMETALATLGAQLSYITSTNS